MGGQPAKEKNSGGDQQIAHKMLKIAERFFIGESAPQTDYAVEIDGPSGPLVPTPESISSETVWWCAKA